MEQLSLTRLEQVHPLLKEKVIAAAAQLEAQGTFIRVVQGLRTYAEQAALYAQGRTEPGHIVTNAPAGYSNHNFGYAVDVVPFLSGEAGILNWSANTPQFQAVVTAMRRQGLYWGGLFDDLKDLDHFQLANFPVTPTDKDRSTFDTAGLMGVWSLYA